MPPDLLKNASIIGMGAEGFEPPSAGFFWCRMLFGFRSVLSSGRCSSWSSSNLQTHSSSFPCNWSPLYYQAILYPQGLNRGHCLFSRRARLRRRSFLRRHFQCWLPCFFQARLPRFMGLADLLPIYERIGRPRTRLVSASGFEPRSPA